jgi:hypothetical protein
MLAGARDAGRGVGLVQEHAHLRALEQHHRILGMGGGHAIERVPGIAEAAGVEVEQAELELTGEPAGIEAARPLEGVDGGGGPPKSHLQVPERGEIRRGGTAQRVQPLAQGYRLLHAALALAQPGQRLEHRQPVRRLGERRLEQWHGLLPPGTTGVVERQVDPHVERAGRDLGGLGEHRLGLPLVAERRVRRRQPQRGIQVERVGGEDPLEQRDHLRVLAGDEEARRPVDRGEEADHVGRAGRALPHLGHRGRADVAQAGQRLARVVIETLGRTGRRRQRHGIIAKRVGHRRSGSVVRGQVARLGRIGHDIVDFHAAGQDRLLAPVHGHHLGLPAVLEKRLHRLAHDHFGRCVTEAERLGRARKIEERVKHATSAHGRVVHANPHAGSRHHQRHVHRGLIEEVAVQRLAVLAESLAVVADDHNRRRSRDRTLEGRHQAAELLVHRGHFTKVRPTAKPAEERLGRGVRIMRIEVVDPEEQRLRARLGEEGQDGIRCRPGAPFDRSGRQRVIVAVEPARETELPRQDERRDEGRGAVAGLAEPLGGDRLGRREKAAVLVKGMRRRVDAGQHRGVRRERFGHRRVGLPEPHAPRRQRIEAGRANADRLGPDRIRPRRVEGDQQDGRTNRRRPGRLRRGRTRLPASPTEHCREQPRHHPDAAATRPRARRLRRPHPHVFPPRV